MKTARVIIGANYGDEGKVLMTDYFAGAAPSNTLIVRFNGGAQAGHTVTTPDGRRHVFSHIGSGAFWDCPTYLSKFFIVNPLVFNRELAGLRQLRLAPQVVIHPAAFLTTPLDMFVNQTLERRRGGTRHGSCGLGINETVTRCLRGSGQPWKTTAADLVHLDQFHQRLIWLAQTWLPQRLAELDLDAAGTDIAPFVARQFEIIAAFVGDCAQMLDAVASISESPPEKPFAIFEGAQGLMLDEDRIDQWPHVTRSRTGLTNVLSLARAWGLERLSVTYVTRTYLTRHGAGPLKGECNWRFTDATNIPNPYQGTLRFAPLDTEQLNEALAFDMGALRPVASMIDTECDIAITCNDQLPLQTDPCAFILPVHFMSHGPTRQDVCDLTLARSPVSASPYPPLLSA